MFRLNLVVRLGLVGRLNLVGRLGLNLVGRLGLNLVVRLNNLRLGVEPKLDVRPSAGASLVKNPVTRTPLDLDPLGSFRVRLAKMMLAKMMLAKMMLAKTMMMPTMTRRFLDSTTRMTNPSLTKSINTIVALEDRLQLVSSSSRRAMTRMMKSWMWTLMPSSKPSGPPVPRSSHSITAWWASSLSRWPT
jgi:hypothetical protein